MHVRNVDTSTWSRRFRDEPTVDHRSGAVYVGSYYCGQWNGVDLVLPDARTRITGLADEDEAADFASRARANGFAQLNARLDAGHRVD